MLDTLECSKKRSIITSSNMNCDRQFFELLYYFTWFLKGLQYFLYQEIEIGWLICRFIYAKRKKEIERTYYELTCVFRINSTIL